TCARRPRGLGRPALRRVAAVRASCRLDLTRAASSSSVATYATSNTDRGADMATFNIWMNGRLVPQEQAVLPVNSAAVFYATNVFEGIRSYWSERDGEMYRFRLADHFARLRESMKMMRFTVPYSYDPPFEAGR